MIVCYETVAYNKMLFLCLLEFSLLMAFHNTNIYLAKELMMEKLIYNLRAKFGSNLHVFMATCEIIG